MSWSYNDIDNFHNRVRAELNNVSSGTLTDDMIDMPEKAPIAEVLTKEKVTEWETYQTEDEGKFAIFQACIVLQTAIYFEDYVITRQAKSMQSSSLNITFNENDGSSKITLRMRLEELLGLLETVDSSAENYYGFRITRTTYGS